MPEIRLTFTEQEFEILRQMAREDRRTPANQAAHIVAFVAKDWAEENAAQTVEQATSETPLEYRSQDSESGHSFIDRIANDPKSVEYLAKPFRIPSVESTQDFVSQRGYTKEQSEENRNLIPGVIDDPDTMPPPTGRTFFIDEE